MAVKADWVNGEAADATSLNAVGSAINTLLAGGGGGRVVDDPAPQLGGNLDVQSYTVGSATPADLTKLHAITTSATTLNNQSGTNTGDQSSIVGITGTTAQFNTALTDNDFATLAGTETLTNKTLTSPTLTTPDVGAATGTSLTVTSKVKAPYVYGGDMTTTYGGYSGGVFGGTATGGFADFAHNNSRIGEFYTTSSAFNFFSDVGKAINFFSNASYGGLPAIGIAGSSDAVTMSSLTSGLVKSTSSVLSIATAGTDYLTPTGAETLTNKTLSGLSNTLTNISADSTVDGTTNKAFLATERTKLAGIATSATANSSDATLEARANHTGTQTASTISDFSAAADARITAATGNSVQAYNSSLTTWAGKTAPSGAVVGDTDTQTLTNKTIVGSANTISAIAISSLTITGTPDGTKYLRDDGSWQAVAGGGSGITRSISTVSTSVTLGATASTDYVALISSTGQATLPTAVSNTNRYTLKNTDTVVSTIILTTSGQTIDGSSSAVIRAYGSLELISDGTNWSIL